MNKIPIVILSIIYYAFAHAQNIEESSYIEKNKIMESLSFSIPICNKEVLINSWKNFIKRQGGKVKGGIINKVYGTDIKFFSGGESWIGNFAYEFNENKNMTIFTSFHDISNSFINSIDSEKDKAIPILLNFKLDIQKSCINDDLTYAKNYSIRLSKEKIHNSERILYLEKIIHDDYIKIDLKEKENITEKVSDYINKIKEKIILNEAELQTLKNRNMDIDKELVSQNMVVQSFKNKIAVLEEKTYTENQTNIRSSEIKFEDNNGDLLNNTFEN
jgi:hypothetical protein